MTIELRSVVIRNERRLRLVFTSPLGASAFATPGPAAYVVDNQDGKGPSPGVASAILVTSAGDNVELALDTDLVRGALYRVTTIGIHGVSGSCTSASDELFRFGENQTQLNVEPKTLDADLLLFGRDLVHTGTDYLETTEGDLAVVGGIVNAMAAHRRRMLGSPLPWAPSYSARARQFVDAPVSSVGGLRGALQQQSLADDRVQSVTVKLTLDGEDSFFDVSPVFKGNRATGTESVSVPIASG